MPAISIKESNLLLHWLNHVARSGTSFFQTQAPLVVKEMIRWGIIKNSFFTILCGIFMVIFIIILLKQDKLKKNYYAKMQSDGFNKEFISSQWLCLIRLNGIGILFMALFFICSLYSTCFIIFAPRLYILDHIKSLF